MEYFLYEAYIVLPGQQFFGWLKNWIIIAIF
jgi:hypothetical protein